MSLTIEIDPSFRLPELTVLSRAQYADITDVGDIDTSFETATLLEEAGIKPIVNMACNDMTEREAIEYFGGALARSGYPILILAGNNWNGDVRPTDMIKFVSRYTRAGAVINTSAPDRGREIELARRKADHGATFFLTQPIWSYEDAREWKEDLDISAEIYWGLFPAKDLATVQQLGMPGVYVPEHLRNGANGVEVSKRLLQGFLSHDENVYIMGRRYGTIERIL